MSERTIRIPLSDEIDASAAEDLNTLKKDLATMGVRLTIPDALPGGALVFEYDDEATSAMPDGRERPFRQTANFRK